MFAVCCLLGVIFYFGSLGFVCSFDCLFRLPALFRFCFVVFIDLLVITCCFVSCLIVCGLKFDDYGV